MATLNEKIAEYLEVRDAMAVLEARKKALSADFKAGLAAWGASEARLAVGDKIYRISMQAGKKSRTVPWDVFMRAHPDLYEQFVTEKQGESFVKVDEVKQKASERVKVDISPLSECRSCETKDAVQVA